MANIRIYNKDFESKKSAIEHISKVFRHNGNKDYAPPSESFYFIKAILDLHPEASDKLAHGLECFRVVMKNQARTNYTVYIVNKYGEMLDFSWRKCFGFSTNNLTAAMRHSIIPQINSFRDNEKDTVFCSICFEPLDIKESHVDHVIKFRDIKDNFLKTTTIKIPKSFSECSKTHAATFKSCDSDFSQSWQDFHKNHAILRILCKRCNLKLR